MLVGWWNDWWWAVRWAYSKGGELRLFCRGNFWRWQARVPEHLVLLSSYRCTYVVVPMYLRCPTPTYFCEPKA
jgi:hypothetical protein